MTRANKTPPLAADKTEDEIEIEQHLATLRRGDTQAAYDFARARIAKLRGEHGQSEQ
jgi:hypothetical protein